MPAGPLPQCNQYLTGQVQMGEGWLQVWCYLYRDAIPPDMSADPVPLSHTQAYTVQLYQTCMLRSFDSDTCICSASLSGKASGLLQIH